MLIKFDINNENCKNNLINFIKNSEASERKGFLKQFKTDEEFKLFFTFIVKNRLATLFKCRNSSNLFSLNTGGNYLNYLFILMMSDPYMVNFDSFYDYFDLDQNERNYINELFYFDVDYKEKINHIDIVKNVIEKIYSIETIKSYFNMKFKDVNASRLYKKLSLAFEFIEKYPDYFKENDMFLYEKLSNAFKHKFNIYYMLNNYPTKTSLEPVTGFDVKRFEGSTITSPTRTTGLPLTKTVVEPVIETPSCVSPVTGCVCLSHLSPTRTTGLPLTKTSLEPVMDFLGG